MKFTVELTKSAEADLNDIIQWIARNDSADRAFHVLDQIPSKLESLCLEPVSGSIPQELRNLGIDRYRQIFFKPYRIIYQVREKRVMVSLVADGRRDMSVLLQRRLTAPL